MDAYKNPKDLMPIVGDWVRFYQSGRLVIGCIEYIGEDTYYPWGLRLRTDIGSINIADALEARRKI